MEFKPKVSIIIPCYNYGYLISETLTNLLKQTLVEWEAIIIDDGSTDNTKLIVNTFCRNDSRFKYLYQKKSGVSVARNFGLKSSSGKYIQFLDADDLISSDKLFKQVNHLESNPEISISYCRNYYFDHNYPQVFYVDFNLTIKADLTKEGNNIKFPKITIDELIEENPLVINSPLFKKEIYLEGISFTEGNRFVEDWEFWINCILNNHKTAFCDYKNVYSLVRKHHDSASTNYFLMKVGEGRLRKRISTLIRKLDTSLEKKEDLQSINNNHRNNIFKILLFNTPLADFSTLKMILAEAGYMLFFKCFFKALNMKRKMI